MSQPDPPAALPPREPRSWFVHAAVDTAVAFLLLVIVLLILGVSFWIVLITAVLVGLAAAPFTRRAEVRALEARKTSDAG